MSQELLSTTLVIQNALLASRLARRVSHRLSMHGINLTEYLVMHYLSGSANNAVPRIELAEHIGMSASGVTRLIAPMEKNGLITKRANPRDARQSLVKLSKTGMRLYREASVSFESVASDSIGGLSRSQQSKLVELLAKVL